MNNEAVAETITNPNFALVMPDADIARGDWCGYVTVENIEAVVDKIEAYLKGQRYSRLFIFNGEGDLRTSQQLVTGHDGKQSAVAVHREGTNRAEATITDYTSMWFFQTTAHTGRRKTCVLQPYIEFSQKQIRMAHFGNRVFIPEGESPIGYIHQWWIALELDPNRS